jgi:hypothetical protein
VKPDLTSAFACEYVPPTPSLPVSQTCDFQLRPVDINLHPFSHTRGDTDKNTDGAAITGYDPSRVNLTIDATVTRNNNDLVLIVSGRMEESESDWTTYIRAQSFLLGYGQVVPDILNGTRADVSACFAAYGSQRPFPGISGQLKIATGGNGFKDYPASWGTGPLRFSAHCRVDESGSNDVLGCDRISFEPFRLVLK